MDERGSRACWRRGYSRAVVHKIEVLCHGVDLIVKFAGKLDNLVDERLTPDGRFGQVNLLAANFWHVIVQADCL